MNKKKRIWLIPLLFIIILLLIPLYPMDALPETITTAAGSVFDFSTRYKFEYDHGSSTEINGGSAFVISTNTEKTYLLTCAHCVNEQILEGGIVLSLGEEQTSTTTAPVTPTAPEKITLFFDYSNWVTANPMFISEEYDVAVLEIPTEYCADKGIELTPLVLTEPAWLGKVFALGYPDFHDAPLLYDENTGLTITSGRITAFMNLTPFEKKFEEKPIGKVILHSAEVHPGNSGGPLLNAKGEVVGINCCMTGSHMNYGGSVDSITLGKILKENEIAYEHHLNIRLIRDIILALLVLMLLLLRPKKAN